MSKKSRIILVAFIVLAILGYTVYYLFLPEFKQSKLTDYVYVYVDDGSLFKKNYLIKQNGGEMHIDLNRDKFTIYLPHHFLMKNKWKVSGATESGIKVKENYIKKCRTPIYDWNKDGSCYDMQVFKFEAEKGFSGDLIFTYEEDDNSGIEDEKKKMKIIVKIN